MKTLVHIHNAPERRDGKPGEPRRVFQPSEGVRVEKRHTSLERAYIMTEGVVVEYLVECQHGKVLTCVIFAEDPAKALKEAEGAIAIVEAA